MTGCPLPNTLLFMWRESKPELLQDVAPLLLFAGFIAAVAMAPELGDAALIAIATIFIGGAFYAARNLALAVIALAIPLARHATLALEPTPAIKVGYVDPPQPAASNEPAPAMLAISALLVALVGGTFSNRLKTWKPVPAGAVAFMEQRGLHGNILNQYEWGAYLVWHAGGDSKVFIDGRCELIYPDRLIRQYAIFFFGMEGADGVLNALSHDFVLIGPHTKAYDVVDKDSRWQLIYRDATAALFKRASLHGEVPTGGSFEVGEPSNHAAGAYFP